MIRYQMMLHEMIREEARYEVWCDTVRPRGKQADRRIKKIIRGRQADTVSQTKERLHCKNSRVPDQNGVSQA